MSGASTKRRSPLLLTDEDAVTLDDRLVDLLVQAEEWQEQGRPFTVEELCPDRPDLWPALRDLLTDVGRLGRVLPAARTPSVAAPTPFSVSADDAPPRRLGDYRILREVGRGGMGVVYEAEQISLRRRVALKVLPAHAARDAEALERFRREARAAAGLHHTNIVPVFEVGEEGDVFFYAMQFIEGRGLDRVVDEWRRAPQDAATAERFRAAAGLMRQAAEALAHAHEHGVVHRDVKPSNLLLDGAGVVWVVDFGLAYQPEARARDEAPLTGTGQVVGTLRYVAPERFGGACDARADVYALGLTLYELVALRPAYDGDNAAALVEQIWSREPPRPRSLVPALPRDLETVVLKASDKDPGRRYPSAREMADDLRRFLADEPVRARRAGAAERAARWARRNPVVALLLAAVVLVTAAGFAFSLRFGLQAADNAREATDYAGRLEVEKTNVETERAAALRANDRLRQTLDRLLFGSYKASIGEAHRAADAGGLPRARDLLGSALPRPGEKDLRRFEWYYLDRLTRDAERSFLGHTGGVRGIAFDGAGTRVASASLDGTAKIWDAASGRELLTLRSRLGPVEVMAFSRDGRRLALTQPPHANPNGVVELWDTEAPAKAARVLTGLGANVLSLDFSPDGALLAGALEDGSARVWDVARGDERFAFPGPAGLGGSVAFSEDGRRLFAARSDAGVRAWDVAGGREVGAAARSEQGVIHSALSRDGSRLVLASNRNYVKSFDALKKDAAPLRLDMGAFAVAVSPDGSRAAAYGGDRVPVWDTAGNKVVLTLASHRVACGAAAFSADGRRLATGDETGEMRIWSLAEPAPPAPPLPKLFVCRGGLSPDGTRYAGCPRHKGPLVVWDLRAGGEPRALEGHTDVGSAVFSSDGSRLASASRDGTAKVWDARTGRALLTIRGHDRRLGDVAFSHDGRCVATAAETMTPSEQMTPGERAVVKVWDAETGRELQTLRAGTGSLSCVAFSPDGTKAAAGGDDRIVRLWDVASGRELFALAGHLGRVEGVAFSPDGARLASASDDATVRLWDLDHGQEVLTLRGAGGSFQRVAFSADGKRLSCISGEEMRVWDAGGASEPSPASVWASRGEFGRAAEEFEEQARRAGAPAWYDTGWWLARSDESDEAAFLAAVPAPGRPRGDDAPGFWYGPRDVNGSVDLTGLEEVFAVTWLYARGARALSLSVGPGANPRVWANGVLVHEGGADLSAAADPVVKKVVLADGWNTLVVRPASPPRPPFLRLVLGASR